MVDNIQENLWLNWYCQWVEILWSILNLYQDIGFIMQDKCFLFCFCECFLELFCDFNDNVVLVYGNFILCSMLKDLCSDQLLVMVGLGMMLWVLCEYELFCFVEGGQVEQLLWCYLQQVLVFEVFVWWCWFYLLWDEVDSLVNIGCFDCVCFDFVVKLFLFWFV